MPIANCFQSGMDHYLSARNLTTTGRLIQIIHKHTDGVLERLSPFFEAMFNGSGRSSIPPEQLLKGQVLIRRAWLGEPSERRWQTFYGEAACNLLRIARLKRVEAVGA